MHPTKKIGQKPLENGWDTVSHASLNSTTLCKISAQASKHQEKEIWLSQVFFMNLPLNHGKGEYYSWITHLWRRFNSWIMIHSKQFTLVKVTSPSLQGFVLISTWAHKLIANSLMGCSTNFDCIFDLINIAICSQMGLLLTHWEGSFGGISISFTHIPYFSTLQVMI